jgi:NurA-like 5'-3' nuclease
VEVNGEKITPPLLGEKIATTLAKWEEAGDVGKIQNFKNAKDNLWQELTDINKKSIPGTDELVSRSRVAEEARGIPTPALKFVNQQIAEVMENRVPELLKLLEG